MTAASARIVVRASEPTVCAVLSSVCAITVDNSGVYVYYLIGLCPYVSDAWLRLWVFLEHAFACVSTTNQAEQRSSATHLRQTDRHSYSK